MTKNSEYIIPKVEIVSEVKDEYKVPSFEEFMGTYEGNVNYADLGGGDVSKMRGYGPCVPSYCECDCNRSDCNCREGEMFVKLYISCPAINREGVPCPGGSKNPTDWYHAMDGYHTWISNQARIRCERSNCSTNHMKDWNFKCADSGFHKGEYLPTSYASFKEAIRMITDGEWGEGSSEKVDRVMFQLYRYIRKPENKW